jgi:hypothetical protein
MYRWATTNFVGTSAKKRIIGLLNKAIILFSGHPGISVNEFKNLI